MTKQGNGATGQVINGLALVLGGRGTFGETGEFKFPDWEFETVDEESTTILKSPKISFVIKNLAPSDIKAINRGDTILLIGNLREDGRDKRLEISLKIQLHKMATSCKEGEAVERTFEGRLDYYEEKVAGVQTVKYQRNPLFLDLGDGNIYEEFNKNVGVN